MALRIMTHNTDYWCAVSYTLCVPNKPNTLSVIMLNLIMLNVIMLSVIMLNVVAPCKHLSKNFSLYFFHQKNGLSESLFFLLKLERN